MVANDLKKTVIDSQNADNLTFKEKLRRYLKNGIEKESLTILEIQKRCQNPILHGIMKIATFTGNDDFYTIFIPMLFWCDISDYGLMKKEFFKQINFLARNLVLSFAYSTFTTGLIKDYLSLPRPKSPPVIRKLKKSYVDYEFGCPSTHSANSCVLFLNLLFFFLTFIKPVITTSHPLMIFIYTSTILFIFLVSLSRIYFGLHSFLDITVGIIVGIIVTVLNWFVFYSFYENLFYSSFLGPIVQFIIHRLLLIYVHPDPEHYCPCFEDSYSFFSFFDGIAIGSWLDKKYFGNESPVKSYTIKYGKVLGLKDYLKKEPPVYQNMKKSFLRYGFLNDLYDIFGIKSILLVRFIIGLITVLCYKKLVRKTILFIANKCFSIDKNSENNRSKSDLNKIEKEKDKENEEQEDEDNFKNHKKKYHLPRHSAVFLSRNIEYIGIGLILYIYIHLFKELQI